MKQSIRILIALVTLAFLSLAAWNFASARSGLKPVGEMEMTGRVESIQPTFWMVSGLQLAVLPSTEIKGAIKVGDLVKVHAQPGAGSSFTAREIELASPNALTRFDDGSTSSNNPAVNTSETEFYGTVEAIDGSLYMIDGRQVVITTNTEVKNAIQVGDQVKVHAWTAADGSLTAREIELALNSDVSGDDQSRDGSSFDDSNSGDSSSDDSSSDDTGFDDDDWDDDDDDDDDWDDDDDDNDDDDDDDDDDDEDDED